MALTNADQQWLVEAHAGGDRGAFDAIVRAYYESLFGHALRRLGEAHAAEDAVQETLVRAYRGLPAFGGEYQLRAWLHRILTNVCHDEGRRRQREHRAIQRSVSADAVDPASDIDDRQFLLEVPREEIVAALTSLPASYREALVLRYLEEKSFGEVAAATGITEGNARLRVFRGRAALRRALGPLLAVAGALALVLRRDQRAAVAASLAQGPAAPSAAAVASAHLAAAGPLAEPAMALADRAATLSGLLGVAASLVVPAALPVVGNGVVDRVVAPDPPVVEEAVPLPVAVPDVGPAPIAPALVAEPPAPPPAEPRGDGAAAADVLAAPVEPMPPRPPVPVELVEPVGGPGGGPGTEEAGAVVDAPTASLSLPPPGAPAPAVAQPARLRADALSVVAARRLEVVGAAAFSLGGEEVAASLRGSLRRAAEPASFGPAGPIEPFSGELQLVLPDGVLVRLALKGSSVAAPDGSRVAGMWRHLDACTGEERASGTFTGRSSLAASPAASSLALDLSALAPDVASLPCA